MTTIGKRIVLVLLLCGTVGCDRVSKHFAAMALAGTPRQSFLADTVRLEYVENTGAFLGLGANWPPAVRTAVFTVGTGGVWLALAIAAFRRRWSGWSLVGLWLYLAGGGSNLADRVAKGSVVDFLNVGLGPLRTGIFNVADMAILAGIGLLVAAQYHEAREKRPPSESLDT